MLHKTLHNCLLDCGPVLARPLQRGGLGERVPWTESWSPRATSLGWELVGAEGLSTGVPVFAFRLQALYTNDTHYSWREFEDGYNQGFLEYVPGSTNGA